MRRRARRGAILLGLLPFLTTACYTYAPIGLDEVEVDQRISAVVDGEEADRLRQELGGERRVVRGRVAALLEDTVFLTVAGGTPMDAASAALGHTVAVPHRSIRRVDLRRLDQGRTAGAVLGSVALLGFIVYQAFVREDPAGQSGENPPPVNEARRLPGVRIPLGSP